MQNVKYSLKMATINGAPNSPFLTLFILYLYAMTVHSRYTFLYLYIVTFKRQFSFFLIEFNDIALQRNQALKCTTFTCIRRFKTEMKYMRWHLMERFFVSRTDFDEININIFIAGQSSKYLISGTSDVHSR